MFDILTKGGLLMWPIGACSVIALAIVIYKIFQFQTSMRLVSLTATQALSRRPALLKPLLEAVENGKTEKEILSVGTAIVRETERGLGTLSLISAISPLLGLTGTVVGMIQAFQVIAASGAAVNPGILASGIWEALITTAAGLLVAIPVHVAHHYLDARMGTIVQNLESLASQLVAERTDAI